MGGTYALLTKSFHFSKCKLHGWHLRSANFDSACGRFIVWIFLGASLPATASGHNDVMFAYSLRTIVKSMPNFALTLRTKVGKKSMPNFAASPRAKAKQNIHVKFCTFFPHQRGQEIYAQFGTFYPRQGGARNPWPIFHFLFAAQWGKKSMPNVAVHFRTQVAKKSMPFFSLSLRTKVGKKSRPNFATFFPPPPRWARNPYPILHFLSALTWAINPGQILHFLFCSEVRQELRAQFAISIGNKAEIFVWDCGLRVESSLGSKLPMKFLCRTLWGLCWQWPGFTSPQKCYLSEIAGTTLKSVWILGFRWICLADIAGVASFKPSPWSSPKRTFEVSSNCILGARSNHVAGVRSHASPRHIRTESLKLAEAHPRGLLKFHSWGSLESRRCGALECVPEAYSHRVLECYIKSERCLPNSLVIWIWNENRPVKESIDSRIGTTRSSSKVRNACKRIDDSAPVYTDCEVDTVCMDYAFNGYELTANAWTSISGDANITAVTYEAEGTPNILVDDS